MATYEWPELISLWSQGKLDTDQLIGQALQWGRQIYETATACQQEHKSLTRQMAAGQAQQMAAGQAQQVALEQDMAALRQRIEALEAQLFPKAKG